MIDKRITLSLVFFIVLLVLFDAIQQKYYIDTFDLAPNGTEVSLGLLLQIQLIKWTIWVGVGVFFGIITGRILTRYESYTPSSKVFILFGLIIFSVLLSIGLISMTFIFREGIAFTQDAFYESFKFNIFQKGLTFFLAFAALTLILNREYHLKTIGKQTIEIKSLIRISDDLKGALEINNQEEPHLSIKTGNKLRSIALDEIIWIQADDYCVKIHTEEKSYTLRKSLKSLELQLTNYNFIRIHRGALLNLNYLDQINFDASTIRLRNSDELPLSKSGIKSLKSRLKEAAI